MKNLYHLILLLLLTSCAQQNKSNQLSLAETTDSLKFQLPSDVSVDNPSFQLFTDDGGKEYLGYYDKENCRLGFYGLQSHELERTIQLQREGPQGIGRCVGFIMNGFNEIYMPRVDVLLISVVDSLGAVKRRYDLTDKQISIFHSISGMPSYLIGDKLYSLQNSLRNWDTEGFLPSATEVCMDISTGEVTSSPCITPSSYRDKVAGKSLVDMKYSEKSRCYDGKNLVYSFYGSPDLVVMSPDFKNVSTRPASSRYIPDMPVRVEQRQDGIIEELRLGCTDAMYGNIVYDPYRKLYYRFAYPETELEEKDPNLLNLWQHGRNEFSIIILDEDLNVVGETQFPRDRFRSNLYFVCKDGFYISCNHYKNPGYTDDELQFVKFEVKGNSSDVISTGFDQ